MPAIKLQEFLGLPHTRIICHPIKFLGIAIPGFYRKEIRHETYAEGLKRIQEEMDVLFPEVSPYEDIFI